MTKKRRWALAGIPAVLVLFLLASLPFVVRRSQAVYTDGARLREPEERARTSLRDVLWERPERIPGEVDLLEGDRYEPCVSPEGGLLGFTRGRPGGNAD